MDKIIDIFKIIEPYKDIVITGHVKPDGDAIGACMAVALSLELYGKNPVIVLEDYSSKYDIIPGKNFLYKRNLDDISAEVFIVCDCGGINRLTSGTRKMFDNAEVTINIDHHESNNGFADYNYVKGNASSTSELVYDLIEDHINIDEKIATCIYAGIIYDTGGLRFPSTSGRTMEIVSKIMKQNIDFTKIYSDILLKRSFGDIKALSRALNNLKVYENYKLSMTSISFSDLDELEITSNELDGIVQFINNIEDVETSVFVYQVRDDLFKISLRSTYLDVNKVANFYGGGGHKLASGATIEGTKDEVYEKIKKHIINEIMSEEK